MRNPPRALLGRFCKAFETVNNISNIPTIPQSITNAIYSFERVIKHARAHWAVKPSKNQDPKKALTSSHNLSGLFAVPPLWFRIHTKDRILKFLFLGLQTIISLSNLYALYLFAQSFKWASLSPPQKV